MEYLPQNDAEGAELNLAYKNGTTAYVQGRMVRVVGMSRGIPARYLLEVVEREPQRLKTASEMRQVTEERNGSTLNAERLQVRGRIEQAAKEGQTSVTYYEPISEAMMRELADLGYKVKAESHQVHNGAEWNVHISWGTDETHSERP